MLLSILLAAMLLPASPKSIGCVAFGATTPNTVQTDSLRGPGGVAAVLKVSSNDDASKNSHHCSADYQLILTRGKAAPEAIDLLTSDDEYGRLLSIQLSGFSQDGKRVFGILAESGRYPLTMLFEYDESRESKVRLIDLRKRFAEAGAKCLTTYEVTGTTEPDAVVVAASSPRGCLAQGSWLVPLGSDRPTRLMQKSEVIGLYPSGANPP